MEIFVSTLRELRENCHINDITHVLSVITADMLHEIKLPSNFNRDNWLFENMDDMIDIDAPKAPTKAQIYRILKWGRSLPADAKVLVHCYAGVSRSTASALILKVQEQGISNIDNCIKWLVNHRPNACPNPVIMWHADELLSADGILFKKSEEVANARLIKALE